MVSTMNPIQLHLLRMFSYNNQEQIKDLKNAYIVKDDIEYDYQNVVRYGHSD